MFIVEGSDHVGKTTFCYKLIKEMRRQKVSGLYRHMSKPDESFDYFGDYLKLLRPGDVYDRFHYGAYVYGAMLCLHPTDGFSVQTMQMVSRFIHLRRGLIVLMYDSNGVEYKRRLEEESKDEMFGLGDILLANQLFLNIELIDKPDILIDVSDGFPTDEHAEMVVSQWRLQNAS